jgi:hypothetical protein
MEEPMDTSLRDPDDITWRDEVFVDWADEQPPVEPETAHVQPQPWDDPKPTYLHSAAVIAAASGYAGFLLISWVVFFGSGYMGLTLVVATLISVVMLGLMAAFGVKGPNVVPWQRPWQSFHEFLEGEVEVWGGRIPGREAFVQLAATAWCLTALALVFGIIVEAVRP